MSSIGIKELSERTKIDKDKIEKFESDILEPSQSEIQSIATVSNAHHPWGNVSILGSDYMLFARMMYL